MPRFNLKARVTAALVAVAAFHVALPAAQAQPYPNRPVKIVVPFPPGGATDNIARMLAEHLSSATGQSFVVTNVPGASGSIGHEQVARSPGDGYTLIVGTASTIAGNPAYNKVKFDPIKDFTPIALLTTESMAVIVHPSVPVDSVKSLIELAKAKPGSLNMASFGNGSISHLAGELFKTMAGVNMTHVPYKGSGPALVDMVGGQVQVMFHTLSVSLPPVRDGRLRLLAVTDERRKQIIPEVPTVAESGLPGYSAITWLGLFGPANMPADVVSMLSRESAKMLARPDIREKLMTMASEPESGKPEDLAMVLARDYDKWRKTIKDAGIQAP